MLAAVIAALLMIRGPKLEGAETALSLAVFATLVGARAAFSTERTGPYWGLTHFTSAFTWVLLLCRLIPNVIPGGARPSLWTRRFWAVTLLIVSVIGIVGGAVALASPESQAFQAPHGRVAIASQMVPFFQAIEVNVRQGELVWVLPEINGIDALFLLHDISPYPSHLPGWLDERAEGDLLRRIEKRRPDVVILFARKTKEYGVAPFGQGYDRALSKWVNRNYAPVVEMPAGQILRPRDFPIASP